MSGEAALHGTFDVSHGTCYDLWIQVLTTRNLIGHQRARSIAQHRVLGSISAADESCADTALAHAILLVHCVSVKAIRRFQLA